MKNPENPAERDYSTSARKILFADAVIHAAGAAGVRAQNPPVSINAKAITINELFTRIEKQGVYTFAYNNADIDLKRVVTVHTKERPIDPSSANACPKSTQVSTTR
ncbi:MAG: hypothetical protein ACLRMJ_03760 [Alistipes finegoldii]